jgi:fucose 4-O-acetylase-like acetyltransferase
VTLRGKAVSARLPWVDSAKGIGIVLVVYGHVFLGLVSAGLAGPNSAVQISVDVIYTFHMPLFFFLAGLFAKPAMMKEPRQFWLNRIALLAYTYLLWSVLQGTLQIAFADYSNHPPSFSTLARILWEPRYQFWFLYALFWSRLAFAALWRLGDFAVALIASCAFVTTFYVEMPLLGMVLWGFFYFALGSALSSFVLRLPLSIIATAVSAVGFIIAVAMGLRSQWPELAAVPAALCGIATTVLLSQHVASSILMQRVQHALAVLGSASMSIFVMHVAAAAAVRALLAGVLDVKSVAAHLVLGTAAGVVLPVLATAVLDRARLSAWFGLATRFPSLRRPAAVAAAPG